MIQAQSIDLSEGSAPSYCSICTVVFESSLPSLHLEHPCKPLKEATRAIQTKLRQARRSVTKSVLLCEQSYLRLQIEVRKYKEQLLELKEDLVAEHQRTIELAKKGLEAELNSLHQKDCALDYLLHECKEKQRGLVRLQKLYQKAEQAAGSQIDCTEFQLINSCLANQSTITSLVPDDFRLQGCQLDKRHFSLVVQKMARLNRDLAAIREGGFDPCESQTEVAKQRRQFSLIQVVSLAFQGSSPNKPQKCREEVSKKEQDQYFSSLRRRIFSQAYHLHSPSRIERRITELKLRIREKPDKC